jgi:hypothetical protein
MVKLLPSAPTMPRNPTTSTRGSVTSPSAGFSRVRSNIPKYKTIVFGFVLFGTMVSITRNPLHSQWTTFENGMIFRELTETISETTDYVLDNSAEFFTGYIKDEEEEYREEEPKSSRIIPESRHKSLVELTRAHETTICPSNLRPVEMVSNPEADAALGRRIPKIVHMTGKTKCLTDAFYDATKKWQFENHSFYFHDDEAMEELFNRDWPMFPQIKNALVCLKGAGGGKLKASSFVSIVHNVVHCFLYPHY